MSAISKQLRFRVLERCGFKCHYCGRTAPEVRLEVDHIDPQSIGGSNKDSNLVAACVDCNRGKRDDIIEAPWIQRISESLQSSRLIEVEMYCDRSACPAREVTIRVKDYDSDLIHLLKTKGKMRCPVCAKAMKLHHSRTFRQVSEHDELVARWSVNAQRYRRDHCAEGGLCAIPLDEMCNDELPQ